MPNKVKLKCLSLSSASENQQTLLEAVELQGFILPDDLVTYLFFNLLFSLVWFEGRVILSLCLFMELIQLSRLLDLFLAFCEHDFTSISIGALSGYALSSVLGEGHSLYHLQELQKRQFSKLNIDSILAPLINVR